MSGGGLILHCFLSLVSVFFFPIFFLFPPCCSFMLFLPSLCPPSPPFLFSWNHQISEPKETRNRQVQLPRLPARKPGSRKPHAWIVGFCRRDMARISVLCNEPARTGPKCLGSFPPQPSCHVVHRQHPQWWHICYSESFSAKGWSGGRGDRVAKGPIKTVPTLQGCQILTNGSVNL